MPLPRFARLSFVVFFAAPVVACGSSFQTVYEGDVRFEHCYRLDGDDGIGVDRKRSCWAEWLQRSTRGQTRDRVEHARLRLRALDGDTPEEAAVVMKVQVIEGMTAPAPSGSVATPLPLPKTPFEAPPSVVPVAQPAPPPRPAPILAVEHNNGKVTAHPSRTATQTCWHDCGETFTSCAAACTVQKCVNRCGDTAKKCVAECL